MGFLGVIIKLRTNQKECKMSANTSVVCRGLKTFIVVNNPYIMTVLEQTRTGETIKRVYYSPNDISPEDRRDFLLARVLNNVRQQSR